MPIRYSDNKYVLLTNTKEDRILTFISQLHLWLSSVAVQLAGFTLSYTYHLTACSVSETECISSFDRKVVCGNFKIIGVNVGR